MTGEASTSRSIKCKAISGGRRYMKRKWLWNSSRVAKQWKLWTLDPVQKGEELFSSCVKRNRKGTQACTERMLGHRENARECSCSL
jgi:hypothetical protein